MARTSKRKESYTENFPGQDLLSRFGLNRSYVSLALGIIVVVVVGLVGLTLINGGNGLQNISLRDILTGQQDKATEEPSEEVYAVKEGDDLWSISESFYKSGYNWTDIAKANNLDNPDSIEVGQSLVIPKSVKVIDPIGAMEAAPAKPAVQASTQDVDKKIEASSYQVVEGDNLWDISVRAYGDGYRWVEVARVNKLANPDLIFVGTKLNLPR